MSDSVEEVESRNEERRRLAEIKKREAEEEIRKKKAYSRRNPPRNSSSSSSSSCATGTSTNKYWEKWDTHALYNRIEYKVKAKANKYFRNEFKLGSDKRVYSVEIDIDQPKPDPRDKTRFITVGTATMHYWHGQQSKSRTETRHFQITSTVNASENVYCGNVEMRFSR